MYVMQLKNDHRSHLVLLGLLLLVFFLKGVFIAALFPILHGQDENMHYNTIQYLAEPKEKTWPMNNQFDTVNKKFMDTFNFTQEIEETAKAVDYDYVRKKIGNTQSFAEGYAGENESAINSRQWKQYNEDYPPSLVGKPHLYHFLASLIEKVFSQQSILVRFYLIRIFSVVLGTISIFLYFLIFHKLNFSRNISLLMTAIIAFQPMFSITATYVNYDIFIIFAAALFILSCILILKNGLNWKNLGLMATAIALGLLAKGTGIIFLVIGVCFLIFYTLRIHEENKTRYLKYLIISGIILILVFFALQKTYSIKRIVPLKTDETFSTALDSMKKYTDENLKIGRLRLTSTTYWGNLGWSDNTTSELITDIIWTIELILTISLILFLILPRKTDFLPEKKYIIFLLVMLAGLQLGIRFYDWRVYDISGRIEIGAPGRYFLPNIISHFVIMFTGLGMLVRKEAYFQIALKIMLIIMLAFSLYSIFDLIIPRFYL
jgi:hypothetical protein